MRRGVAFLLPAALILLSAPSGCGYRLQSASERFSAPSTRMDVSPFGNDSTTPDAGAWVAARLREELRRGGFQGTFGKTSADYLVEGKVREIRESVFSHGADRFALENRLTLVVDIRVVEVLHGRVVWKEAGWNETTSFFSGPDAQYTEANRRAAFEEAARRIARRIVQTLKVLL